MAISHICGVDGCNNLKFSRSDFCRAHYHRWRRHGSPTGGRERMQGEVIEWLVQVAVPHQGDECLIFPFYRSPQGYGRIAGRKGTSLAHVFVVEKAIGPKPQRNCEVCHDCGNGHLGCVNPGHMYWGTRSQNMLDRQRHGVFVPPPVHLGAANVNSVLTEDDVRQIRRLLSAGDTGRSIAAAFGVSPGTISQIRSRKTWDWVA